MLVLRKPRDRFHDVPGMQSEKNDRALSATEGRPCKKAWANSVQPVPKAEGPQRHRCEGRGPNCTQAKVEKRKQEHIIADVLAEIKSKRQRLANGTEPPAGRGRASAVPGDARKRASQH